MGIFNKKNKKGVVGIDIGTTSIKVVELTPTGKNKYYLSNYAVLETTNQFQHFNNSIQSSSLKPLESDLVSYLTLIKKELNLGSKVYVSLPAFTSFTTIIEVPMASNKNIGKILSTSTENYIPLPVSTVTFDWKKVRENKESKTETIFVASTPNEKIENYYQIFKNSGFELEGYEIENIALARALTRKKSKPTLIIDIGGRSTSITIGESGMILYAGQTDFSSGSFTQALANALNISPRRANELKKTTLIVGGGGDHELSTVLIPLIDAILKEVVRIQEGFEKTFKSKVEEIVLAGAGINMPGLAEYITTKFNLPVVKANPLKEDITYSPEIEPINEKLGATLATAIGLALKKYDK